MPVVELSETEIMIINKIRDIKEQGFGDLNIKIRKKKIVETETKQVEKLEELNIA